MGAKRVERLREQFEREGYLEFRLQPVKVAIHVVFVIAFAVGMLIYALTHGPVLLVLAVGFVAWLVVGVGAAYAEQFFAAGPPLRIDRRGLTLRRWREPLVLDWSDVSFFFPYHQSKLVGPVVGIALSPWVWHDYRASRPQRLRLLDRLTHFRKKFLVLLKVLDVSAADILTLLDADTLTRLTTIQPPYRLMLDIDEDGLGPLWLRCGREAPLAELPLSPALVSAVTDWNRRLVGLLDQDPSSEAFTSALKASAAEGRSLAVHLQTDLGPGSQVLFAGDVPE